MTLSITTKLAPTKPFLLDGDEYELKTLDHLSPDEEARVVALLSKHTQLGMALTQEPNQDRLEQIAKNQKKARITILAMLTTVPKEILEGLPSGAQVQILNALEDIIAGDEIKGGDGDGAGGGDS